MNRIIVLVKNTLVLGFGNILPKFSTVIILPIITASLTKSQFGTYDLVITSLSLILPLFTLMIEQGIFRFLLDSENVKEKKYIISSSLWFLILTSIILVFISTYILNSFDDLNKYLIILYVLLNLYYRSAIQICRGLKLLKNYSIASAVKSILNMFLIIIFLKYMDMEFVGLFISLNISTFISIIYIILSTGLLKFISFKIHSINHLKKLLKYSIPLLPNTISWWIVGISDRWIITTILGVEMNGIYAISNKIPSIFSLVYNNFNLAWQESATTNSKDDDIKDYYSNVFSHLFNFLSGSLLVLISISPYIFEILIDEKFFKAYYQMPILFLAMFFHSFASYYGGIFVAFKQTKNIGLSSFYSAVINIIINISFISKFGLYAASVSTLISYMILTFYRAKQITKYVNIDYNYSDIIIKFLSILVIAFISYLNNPFFNIISLFVSITLFILFNKIMVKNIILIIKNKVNK